MKADGRAGIRVEKGKVGAKDLSFLQHFGHLKYLSINGIKAGLKSLKHLDQLEELSLMNLKQLKCEPLRGLPKLKELSLLSCSIASWNGITDLSMLEELSLYKVSKMPDTQFITQMPRLESVLIEECKELASMPDLSDMSNLTHLWLSHLPNLEDVAGVFKARTLKKLVVTMMPKLEPEDLRPALDHPTLQYIGPSLEQFDDSPKNIRVEEMLRPRFGDLFDKQSGSSI